MTRFGCTHVTMVSTTPTHYVHVLLSFDWRRRRNARPDLQNNVGSKYIKCLYFGYTSASFKTRKTQPEYLGFLGPIVHAEVGDRVVIKYRNKCGFKNSVHAHGVMYDKGSEGTPSDDGSTQQQMQDDAVAPGGRHTYQWVRTVLSIISTPGTGN